ncbi:MAG: hypothetical protein ACXU9U_01045, partial [Parachlamydiaceae bacterium]
FYPGLASLDLAYDITTFQVFAHSFASFMLLALKHSKNDFVKSMILMSSYIFRNSLPKFLFTLIFIH